jgi:hypothetical protein
MPDLVGARLAKVTLPMLLISGADKTPLFRLLVRDLISGRPIASYPRHAEDPAEVNSGFQLILDMGG